VEEEKVPSEPTEDIPGEDGEKGVQDDASAAVGEGLKPSREDAIPLEDTDSSLEKLVEALPEEADVGKEPSPALAENSAAEEEPAEASPVEETPPSSSKKESGSNAFLEDLIGTYRDNVAAELEVAIKEKYEKELDEAKAMIQSLHEEIAACKDAIESHKVVTDDAALDAEREKLSEAQKEIEKLKQQKNTLRATEEMQKRTVDIYKTNYNDLQAQLRDIIERLNDPGEDATALQAEITRLEDEINSERMQREEGEAEIERLRTKRNTLNATIEAQKRTSAIYETNYRALQENIKDLHAQLDNPENDPVTLKQEVAALTEELAKEHAKLQEAQQKTEALVEEKQALMQALDDEKGHAAELEVVAKKAGSIEDLEADLKKQKDIAHEFEEKLQASQKTLAALEAQLKETSADTSTSNAQAELQEAAAVKLQQEKDYLAAQLEMLRTEKNHLETQFTDAKKRILALEVSVSQKALASENVVPADNITPLKKELDTLTKERTSLLSAREEEMTMIQHALKAHKEEKAKLVAEIEELKNPEK